MKNPFEKEDHSKLIAGILIGSIAAGAAAYLFTSDRGALIRDEIGKQFNALLQNFNGGETHAEDHEDHSKDYLQKRHKAPKTNRDDLLKHHVLTANEAPHEHQG